jgi:hypothetical protein
MPPHMMDTLAACGLDLVRIAPGEYPVGLDDEQNALLANPPQVSWLAPPLATPGKRVRVDEFWITSDVLRLGHWLTITTQPDMRAAADLVSDEQLKEIESGKTSEESVIIQPTAGEQQWKDGEAESQRIAQQPTLDPVLSLSAAAAIQVAEALGAALPRWYEWEIATRGPEGWLYPWGNEMDLKKLSLEDQDYSMDEESVMGYYCYDQDVYFIHSFGDYVDAASPFGLVGLAQAGREWNVCHQGEPTADDDYILRSISDLGAMTMMIPGIRPNTWGFQNWYKTKKHLAFSGPVLACYAPSTIGMRPDKEGRLVGERLYERAGFRLVVR